MEELNYKEKETLKIFIQKTLNELDEVYNCLSYIKFVFKEEDLKRLEEYLDKDNVKNNRGLSYLKRNFEEYKNPSDNSDYAFIIVNDFKEFFSLLTEIKDKNNIAFLKSIWLRMNVTDFNNVNEFLRREIDFMDCDIFKNLHVNLGMFNGYELDFTNQTNRESFETNKRILFSLTNGFHTYELPVIHYAIRRENEKLVCYIYGIQNMESAIKYEDIKSALTDTKKKLRNKKVSPEFVMSLKLFVEVLKDKGIYDIKVPLIQVYNYPFHKELSIHNKENYFSYTEEERKKFESMGIDNTEDERYSDYMYTKNAYLKYADKEDQISKNKTERLVDIFMIMEEKYRNIRFLNDPFIEDENLNIKILKK